MSRFLTQELRYWPSLHVGIYREGKQISLVSGAPASWAKSTTGGIVCCLLGLVLSTWLDLDRVLAVGGLIVGIVVVLIARYGWRLRSPLMSFDRERNEVVVKGNSSPLPLNTGDHLEVASFADIARGYWDTGLSLVLSSTQEDNRIRVLSRNNYDHDSFIFHSTSADDQMNELATELAGQMGLALQIAKKQVTPWGGDPTPDSGVQSA